jgi:hypothetical protein
MNRSFGSFKHSINSPFSLCTMASFVAALVLLLAGAQTAQASERHFAFTYEAQVHEKGEWEYEQWVTWKTDKHDDSTFDRFDFRHEIEYGVTENFQLALYVSDWRYEDGKSVAKDGANWRNIGIEGIYKMTDANKDGFGSALYGELKAGDRKFALEGKLILQKNFGKFIAAYNFVLEAEWEGSHLEEDKAEIENTFGLSYQLHQTMNVGMELVHEVTFDDWSETGHNVVYLGPNISYRRSGWWVTIAPLFQVTNVNDEADFMTRLLVGIDF